MQLTLGGKTNGILDDVTGYMGAGAGSVNHALNVDFVFTYDTARPSQPYGIGATLLSARLEIHLPPPEDPFGETFTPGGDLYGSFDIPLDERALINPDGSGYYDVEDAYLSGSTLIHLIIDFPANGSSALDQEMTYYPDLTSSANGPNYPQYGNSIYDLQLLKTTTNDANAVFIYDIFTLSDPTGGTFTGAVNTYYVNFKDITPDGVPEPAAWALMLLGFGSAGAALRRHRAEPADNWLKARSI